MTHKTKVLWFVVLVALAILNTAAINYVEEQGYWNKAFKD
jgi:hypothetical protein